MQQARLLRHIENDECAARNALAATPHHFTLAEGSIGTVIDRLDNGDAFLVEFGTRGPTQCDWFGVLYASEIQPITAVAKAA